jgi:hypothetical protein
MAKIRSVFVRARTKQDDATRKQSGTSKPDGSNRPTITFTGNRHNDTYEVILRSEVVELPRACLKALIGLVLARARSGQGFIQLNPVTVFRLRRAIDKAIGAGAGRSLIETGASEEYRLTFALNGLTSHVALTPCFFELAQLNIVSRESASMLKAVSKEIKKKL